jgi:flagellar export protein FliJ
MRKFKFRLDTVLRYKINLERLAKQSYQRKLQEKSSQLLLIKNLNLEKSAMILNFNRQVSNTGDPVVYKLFYNYLLNIDQVILRHRGLLLIIEKDLKVRFDLWNKKRTEVKIVRKIKTQSWKKYQFELDKAEQHFLDDIFIAKKVREMNNEEA